MNAYGVYGVGVYGVRPHCRKLLITNHSEERD